jgi:hypothetical protein
VEPGAPGVVFDDSGQPWPAQPVTLARRLGYDPDDVDVIAHAIRDLGFVRVEPIRDALLITFEPLTVRRLAAFAAFYEIAAVAPKRLVLAHPRNAGVPDRYQIFNRVIDGLMHIENVLSGGQKTAGEQSTQASAFALKQLGQQRFANGVRSVPGYATGEVAIKDEALNYSRRLSRPLGLISSKDEWLGRVLNIWRRGREGSRLPSIMSLDPLELLNIARGRAHLVETGGANSADYRFRLWGTVNSYGKGYAKKTLGEMPAGPMREDALEDYRGVVATGVPSYQLITHVEGNRPYSYARLLLPLAEDGRHVDELVVLINERPLPELDAC